MRREYQLLKMAPVCAGRLEIRSIFMQCVPAKIEQAQRKRDFSVFEFNAFLSRTVYFLFVRKNRKTWCLYLLLSLLFSTLIVQKLAATKTPSKKFCCAILKRTPIFK